MAPEKRRLHPGNGAWKRRLQWHRQWCLQPANGAWKRRLQWRRQWRLKTAPSMARAMAPENSTMAPEIAPELARENWRNGAFNGAGNGAWTGEIVCQTIRMITQAREDLTWNDPLLCADPKIIKWSITLRSSSCLLRTQGYKGTTYRTILMVLRQWRLQWRQKTASNGAWKWPTDWRQTSVPHRHWSSQRWSGSFV